ncbi:MAG: reverse transcriptase family protein [Nisaea sp.]|uniref:reverse transcriptase family protein n=1 Tax=Nisaea sp. TaxID=2024842 RepID=UPI003263F989
MNSKSDLRQALYGQIPLENYRRIERVYEAGLPPCISDDAIAVILGINPGLAWSLANRPAKHYNTFPVKKGKKIRDISAPRIALKILQKWLSVQLAQIYSAPDHVHGFVPGRSHLSAAQAHLRAKWMFSIDIKDFFPSIDDTTVSQELMNLGYDVHSAKHVTKIVTFKNELPQGAPTSPVISNICFSKIDMKLYELAKKYDVRLTRYADDIVFSGLYDFPKNLQNCVCSIFENSKFDIAKNKTEIAHYPRRIKVHGLLVSGEKLRMTRGYRNKIRAYKHLLKNKNIQEVDVARIIGHVNFSNHIDKINNS